MDTVWPAQRDMAGERAGAGGVARPCLVPHLDPHPHSNPHPHPHPHPRPVGHCNGDKCAAK